MDAIDRALVSTLARSGRASYAELAQLVDLSGPSTGERVRRLEERGVVRGYHAEVDAATFGLDLTAFVSVTLGAPADRAAFLAAVDATPAVLECHHVAGDDDYLIKVVCAGTAGLEEFVTERLKAIPGVARTRTTIVLSSPVERAFVPPLPAG